MTFQLQIEKLGTEPELTVLEKVLDNFIENNEVKVSSMSEVLHGWHTRFLEYNMSGWNA